MEACNIFLVSNTAELFAALSSHPDHFDFGNKQEGKLSKCENIFRLNTCNDPAAAEKCDEISPDGVSNSSWHSGVTLII